MIKVTEYTYRGSNCYILIFANLFNVSKHLKERVCSHRSNFLPLNIEPHLEGQGKQTGSHNSCFPHVKMGRNI